MSPYINKDPNEKVRNPIGDGVHLPPHLEPDALTGTIEAANDQPANSIGAALPKLTATVSGYNDVTAAPVRVIGIGSSVGLGPNGGIDAVNSVSAYLTGKLGSTINRAGNLVIQHHNGSVGGSVITEGYTTHYAAAKTAAGGNPAVVTLAYGMNDGMPNQYHAGQAFPAVYTRAKQLIEAIRQDGGDPIIITSPHPHTVNTPWSFTLTATYPSGTVTPTADYEGSVVTVPAPISGEPVPASYRHLRVNEAMRRAAYELGAVIIDAEKYWFEAVAKYGEDALFNTGQYNHPNLFGFQHSYHKAIDVFAKSLTRPIVSAGAAVLPTQVVKRKLTNATSTSITRVTDAELSFSAGANTVWEVDIDLIYNSPTANDLRVSWEVPAGSTGVVAGIGPSITATAVNGSEVVGRSSTSIDTSIAFGGNTSGAYARARAVVRVGATAGTIGLQYGLDIVGGTCTLYADTVLRARQIS